MAHRESEAQETAGATPSRSPAWKRLLREPLLHFLIIGALLFAIYGIRQRGPGGLESARRIELTSDDLRQLNAGFAAQWQRAPTQEELAGLVEDRVREEILYREALAAGLDKEDAIVRRRMAQKMEFLTDDPSVQREATAAELQSWFQTNSQLFALPERATFRHLYFARDRRGDGAREQAANALTQLAGAPADSPKAGALADAFMFQDYYANASADQLSTDFGPKFATELFRLKPGSWEGPVESSRGWHLVWIDSIAAARERTFSEAESEVKTTWFAARKTEAWDKTFQSLKARYQIVLPPLSTAPEK